MIRAIFICFQQNFVNRSLKYGQDPRRIAYAGSDVDGASVDFTGKYAQSQQTIKDRYAGFELPYNGTDNDDYVNGGGFCCDDHPKLRAGAIGNGNDNPEIYQYYYHSDHLGSTSLITDLDGDMVQHVEYVPFGEVFIEERNNKWNTPYLFNAKELDEETGLYYYGARFYDPRISIWYSTDPSQEKYPGISTYAYCHNNPIVLKDPKGEEIIFFNLSKKGKEMYTDRIWGLYKSNAYFRIIYNTLRESPNKYYLSFEKDPNAPEGAGRYYPNSKGGGRIAFVDMVGFNSDGAFIEEFFHGYQQEFWGNESMLAETGKSNKEFEARFFRRAIEIEEQGGAFGAVMPGVEGLDNFLLKIMGEDKNFNLIINFSSITSEQKKEGGVLKNMLV